MSIEKSIKEKIAERKLNILKGFKETDEAIEKARAGVYTDNAENRAKQRVGQKYGNAKQVDEPSDKQKPVDKETSGGNKSPESKKQPSDWLKETSTEDLKKFASKEDNDPKMVELAEMELDKRSGDDEYRDRNREWDIDKKINGKSGPQGDDKRGDRNVEYDEFAGGKFDEDEGEDSPDSMNYTPKSIKEKYGMNQWEYNKDHWDSFEGEIYSDKLDPSGEGYEYTPEAQAHYIKGVEAWNKYIKHAMDEDLSEMESAQQEKYQNMSQAQIDDIYDDIYHDMIAKNPDHSRQENQKLADMAFKEEVGFEYGVKNAKYDGGKEEVKDDYTKKR